MAKEYIWYTHNLSELDTINKWFENDLCIVVSKTKNTPKGVTVTEFLNYEVDGVKNRTRIFNAYKDRQLNMVVYSEDYIDGDSPFLTGTRIAIPNQYTFKETLAVLGENQVDAPKNLEAFYVSTLKYLMKHEGYKRVESLNDKELGEVSQSFPDITVWMWLRALNDDKPAPKDPTKIEEVKGRLIDVSPFVMGLDTHVDENGGNFSLSIDNIPIKSTSAGWAIDVDGMINYNNNDIINQTYVSSTTPHRIGKSKDSKGQLRRRHFLFHHLVQANDVIFIRFETLEGEKEQRTKDRRKLFLSQQDLPNRIYDMIGLVDSTSLAFSPSNNDLSCRIVGRDLVKTIIDDGSYFYATPVHDLSTLNKGDGLVQRLTANGKYDILAEYAFRSIAWSLQFLINQISGIQVVPNDLFSGYGDRRVRKFRIEGDAGSGTGNFTPTYTDEPARGIWQIIKLTISGEIANRRIADSSIAYPDGSLINQFHKVCQEPFVEFYTDTIGDMFHFIVRQPPLNAEAVQALLNYRAQSEEPIQSSSTAASSSETGGSEKDKTIQKTIITSKWVKTKSGLKLKTKKKTIEVKEADAKEKGVKELEQVLIKNVDRPGLLLTIEDVDVIDDTLDFAKNPAYSVYELKPTASLVGAGEQFVIHFEEYAKVFGANRLSIESQYVPFEAYSSFNFDARRNYIAEQIAQDLVYLIETNAYLPFTRSGTIVLDGDRRIKRGTWIYYKPTEEIYYVTGVDQNYRIGSTIERTTTLTVERGMVRSYARGQFLGDSDSNFCYFNIIDLKLVSNVFTSFLNGDLKENTKFSQELQKTGGVNIEVFNFFLKRHQFLDVMQARQIYKKKA